MTVNEDNIVDDVYILLYFVSSAVENTLSSGVK
jgi:hypothetical protein